MSEQRKEYKMRLNKGHWRLNDGRYLHRIIYEEYHQCTLLPGSVVHHINGVMTDNSIDNLLLMEHGDHSKHHVSGIDNPSYGVIKSEESNYLNSINSRKPENIDLPEGITHHKDGGYVARFGYNKVRYYCGYHKTIEDAVNARETKMEEVIQ
jgi:hypothetical protein